MTEKIERRSRSVSCVKELTCPVCKYKMLHFGKYGAWNTVKDTKTISFKCNVCGSRLITTVFKLSKWYKDV